MVKKRRRAVIKTRSIKNKELQDNTHHTAFTDPPYFDNVQYAELMDFCYVWIKRLLGDISEFDEHSTRSHHELTGNATTGKDLVHFSEGLSRVYETAAKAMKPGAPFAFTYHHNDVSAYLP